MLPRIAFLHIPCTVLEFLCIPILVVELGHHRNFCQKNFKDEKGKIAMTDKGNANILETHYHKVFNRSATVDLTILDSIKQFPIMENYGTVPNIEEIMSTVQGMKNNKAPRITGVTTDMIKNLPQEGTELLVSLIQEFWSNPEVDFDHWHRIKLSNLYKGKGDPQDLNNWFGICLKETTVKIVSIILSKRLLKRLNQVGIPNRFGHVGCQEMLHSIRSTLMIRWHHGHESFVLFVDLFKAFNTIQHEILYKI